MIYAFTDGSFLPPECHTNKTKKPFGAVCYIYNMNGKVVSGSHIIDTSSSAATEIYGIWRLLKSITTQALDDKVIIHTDCATAMQLCRDIDSCKKLKLTGREIEYVKHTSKMIKELDVELKHVKSTHKHQHGLVASRQLALFCHKNAIKLMRQERTKRNSLVKRRNK